MNLQDTLFTSVGITFLMILGHIFVCRIRGRGGFVTGLIIGSTVTTIYCVATLIYPTFTLLGLYLIVSFWLIYLMLFINALNSITLKLLSALYTTPAERISSGDFKLIFESGDALGVRLHMMITGGMLLPNGSSWRLMPKAKLVMAIVKIFKKLLFLD